MTSAESSYNTNSIIQKKRSYILFLVIIGLAGVLIISTTVLSFLLADQCQKNSTTNNKGITISSASTQTSTEENSLNGSVHSLNSLKSIKNRKWIQEIILSGAFLGQDVHIKKTFDADPSGSGHLKIRVKDFPMDKVLLLSDYLRDYHCLGEKKPKTMTNGRTELQRIMFVSCDLWLIPVAEYESKADCPLNLAYDKATNIQEAQVAESMGENNDAHPDSAVITLDESKVKELGNFYSAIQENNILCLNFVQIDTSTGEPINHFTEYQTISVCIANPLVVESEEKDKDYCFISMDGQSVYKNLIKDYERLGGLLTFLMSYIMHGLKDVQVEITKGQQSNKTIIDDALGMINKDKAIIEEMLSSLDAIIPKRVDYEYWLNKKICLRKLQDNLFSSLIPKVLKCIAVNDEQLNKTTTHDAEEKVAVIAQQQAGVARKETTDIPQERVVTASEDVVSLSLLIANRLSCLPKQKQRYEELIKTIQEKSNGHALKDLVSYKLSIQEQRLSAYLDIIKADIQKPVTQLSKDLQLLLDGLAKKPNFIQLYDAMTDFERIIEAFSTAMLPIEQSVDGHVNEIQHLLSFLETDPFTSVRPLEEARNQEHNGLIGSHSVNFFKDELQILDHALFIMLCKTSSSYRKKLSEPSDEDIIQSLRQSIKSLLNKQAMFIQSNDGHSQDKQSVQSNDGHSKDKQSVQSITSDKGSEWIQSFGQVCLRAHQLINTFEQKQSIWNALTEPIFFECLSLSCGGDLIVPKREYFRGGERVVLTHTGISCMVFGTSGKE